MEKVYDAIIVGGGPAGLSAAIYLARAKFSVLVIEKESLGGQITITSSVVNYPGIIETSGKELTDSMQQQAQQFGATFLIADVQELQLEQPTKRIITNKGTFSSVGIILATGCTPRKLGFVGEKEFQGRGVAYCATCDGEFFTGKEVFVIGGGFAACEEAIFLTKYATKVKMVVREEDFTCARTIVDEVLETPNIEVVFNTEITHVAGENQLHSAWFTNTISKETQLYENHDGFGVFVFAGYVPANTLFDTQVTLNTFGNIIVDSTQKTNLDGVYGAGDICQKDLRQVVTAVSDGAIAATSLERYIPTRKQALHLETVEWAGKSMVATNSHMDSAESTDKFISTTIKQQVKEIFDTLTSPITMVLIKDNTDFSMELEQFVVEFASIHEYLTYEILDVELQNDYTTPTITFKVDGRRVPLFYHVVPGGHEFNSFVLAVYNMAGPKQTLDKEEMNAIASITKKTKVQLVVSLSCTMCPDLVQAMQRISIENEYVETEIFDIAKYPLIKEKYNIMSVPCIIINETDIHFGKKDIVEIINMLNN